MVACLRQRCRFVNKQMLQERELAMDSAEHQAVVLDRLTEHPYFARIDVQEREQKRLIIYIGLASFSDGPDNFLIYDCVHQFLLSIMMVVWVKSLMTRLMVNKMLKSLETSISN